MKISFIGLGSVGYYYSEGLIQHGAKVKGYDIMVGTPGFSARVEQCRAAGIEVVNNMEELIDGADMIMVVTTASAAYKTAESAKPYLKKGQIYVELNSAVPSVKKQIEKLLEDIDVVDGTTMSAVNMVKFKALVTFSGHRAKETADALAGYGMNTKYVGDEVGKACALKAVRSIFMKGYEAILMECAHAAYNYGVMDEVLKSIADYFEPKTMEEHYDLFINTNPIYAKRRGEEVDAVAQMLSDDGLDNTMSAAAAAKLRWISTLGLSQHYENEVPNDKHDVIDQLSSRAMIK